ncbi:MAG: YifB family Mg chelatase-like AAA ATPase [Pirellulaceae bacterium]
MPISSSDFRRVKFGSLLNRDHTLNGGVVIGIDGFPIEIQARATRLLDKPRPITFVTTITGMATGAVREALQRIEGAFAKLQIEPSHVEILVNLAPADLPKYGTSLDLPMSVILLQAAGFLPDLSDLEEGDFLLAGELGIHGEIRRIPGALSLAHIARKGQKLIVPAGNECECALILAKPGHEGCRIYPVALLADVIEYFQGRRKLENALKSGIRFESVIDKAVDFGLIRGQQKAKEAAMIAAAGGHNLLLVGPPGEGKSLIASAMPGILPRLTDAEKVELTRIYSACGKLDRDALAVTRRPMRNVHHTASKSALVGGGSGIPSPGEITLAHLGVLFLDELAEFARSTLEAMRQPLETGRITVSRASASIDYPCRFTLVAAMNPCPCGFAGTDRCRCSDSEVRKYQAKISGPLLDRIDLQVQLESLSTEERFADTIVGESERIRAKVERARERQRERFKDSGIPFNAAIPGGSVRDACNFSADGFEAYKRQIEQSQLSTRSMDRLAKVSRTIADLVGSDAIEPPHVDKAAGFVQGSRFFN